MTTHTTPTHLALEGLALLDPEAQWIATELAAHYSTQRKDAGQKVTVQGLANAYCPAIAKLVAERAGVTFDTHRLSDAEATRIGTDALVRLDRDQKLDGLTRIALAARFVMAAAKLRIVSPTPLPEISGGGIEYWPFGQEGGFCNPYKLDALES